MLPPNNNCNGVVRWMFRHPWMTLFIILSLIDALQVVFTHTNNPLLKITFDK